MEGVYDGHSLLNAIKLRHVTLDANVDIKVKAEKLNITIDEAHIANFFENKPPSMFAVGQKYLDLASFPLPALRCVPVSYGKLIPLINACLPPSRVV